MSIRLALNSTSVLHGCYIVEMDHYLSPLDKRIIAQINDIRALNNCCTAGEVARRMQLSRSYIIQRCEVLRAAGILDWTRMAGSLVVTVAHAANTTEGTAQVIVASGVVILDGEVVESTGPVATPPAHVGAGEPVELAVQTAPSESVVTDLNGAGHVVPPMVGPADFAEWCYICAKGFGNLTGFMSHNRALHP